MYGSEEDNKCRPQLYPRPNINEMSRLPKALKAIFFWVFRWIYSKILSVICCGAPRTIPSTKNSILLESATTLANRIRSQKLTSCEVVRAYTNRIQEINEVLNCVVDERFEEALAEAEKVDEFIRSGTKTAEELESETPFLGVPFTTPESVGVEGLPKTMGSWDRKEQRATADGAAVALLRAGGAIPLACTNVSELCLPRETHNPVFGRTCNPYDTNRSAGGPFGGEGSLIASSGSPLGVAPSVALPCAFNGIFGHKPSISCRCHVGIVSRSSADLLPALKLLSRNSEKPLNLDEPVDLKKLKFYFTYGDSDGVYTSPISEDTRRGLKRAVDHLRNFYKTSVEEVSLKDFPTSKSKIWLVETTSDKNENKINPRKEAIKALFGKSHHTFVFVLASMIEEKLRSATNSDIKGTTEDRIQLFTKLQEMLGSNGVLLCPTQPTPAFHHNESLVKRFDFGYADVFEILGLPTTYCPLGLDSQGLPIGLQAVAATNQDRLTLAVAREIGKVLGGWTPPPTHGNFTLRNTVLHNLHNEKVKTM